MLTSIFGVPQQVFILPFQGQHRLLTGHPSAPVVDGQPEKPVTAEGIVRISVPMNKRASIQSIRIVFRGSSRTDRLEKGIMMTEDETLIEQEERFNYLTIPPWSQQTNSIDITFRFVIPAELVPLLPPSTEAPLSDRSPKQGGYIRYSVTAIVEGHPGLFGGNEAIQKATEYIRYEHYHPHHIARVLAPLQQECRKESAPGKGILKYISVIYRTVFAPEDEMVFGFQCGPWEGSSLTCKSVAIKLLETRTLYSRYNRAFEGGTNGSSLSAASRPTPHTSTVTLFEWDQTVKFENEFAKPHKMRLYVPSASILNGGNLYLSDDPRVNPSHHSDFIHITHEAHMYFIMPGGDKITIKFPILIVSASKEHSRSYAASYPEIIKNAIAPSEAGLIADKLVPKYSAAAKTEQL
ncbi:uncharacterized protein BJ171DRAFT_565579 [Polychytrium aggregatum]|uniref:uncharacterized protein n=1 Tax=Polychytrium aggregatum TaxID=110093 RepID=UPI0022FE8B1B|nr:uncharacterized protein BJ171DRAFT_565579 [Polychytrium aggregatum]KAI9207814.1 hypothetical protein BJ171DRAFT_565579 [Polychytrium aggregatum]